ncbi:hypothetical protein JEZ13_04230 [bacterium]|nr:hypothetical protein [bacterium]MBI9072933.1 hypothetical protein [Melioribacteraceae bacterium]
MTYVEQYNDEINKPEGYGDVSKEERARIMNKLESLIFDDCAKNMDGSCKLSVSINTRGNS